MNKFRSFALAFVFLFSIFGLKAQGINFEHGSVSEILEIAKKENKIVFVDIIINSFKDKINKRNNIDTN